MKTNPRKPTGIFLLLGAGALAVACSKAPPTDASINADVQGRINTDNTLKANLNVSTTNQVVTLSGTVADESSKTRAIADARQAAGVKDVVDQITIEGSGTDRLPNAGRTEPEPGAPGTGTTESPSNPKRK